MTAHWLTILIVIYLALGAISGWRRGLVLVAFSVVGYIAGLWLASRYQARLTALLFSGLPVGRWVRAAVPVSAASIPGAQLEAMRLAHTLVALLAFLVILGGAELLARTVGQAVTGVVKHVILVRSVNTLGGLVAGLVENAVLTGLVLGLVLALPFVAHSAIADTIVKTPLAQDLVRWVGLLVHWPERRWLL
jgi:uncharacterized membrane protein required for colicin V production